MRFLRLTALLAALAVPALLGAAAAFATGPSAGDNQYTDPLGSSSTSSTTSSAPAPTSTAPPPSSTSSPPASQGTPASGSSSATSATPTASTTTVSSSSTTGQATSTLPRTGFNALLAVAVGLGLLATGIGLRRRMQRT